MTRAIVIKANNTKNIGKIVEILERADFTDAPIGAADQRFGVVWLRGSTETVWVCRTLSGPFFFKECIKNAVGVWTNVGYFSESQLSSLPDEEEECYEEVVDYVINKKKNVVNAFFQSIREQFGKE